MKTSEKLSEFGDRIVGHFSFMQGAFNILAVTDMNKVTYEDFHNFCLGIDRINTVVGDEVIKVLRDCEQRFEAVAD